VILDLVSGPSARSRRDRASTPRDSRWDEIISHPRQPRFHSRSWVEIKSVRRNYSRMYTVVCTGTVRTSSESCLNSYFCIYRMQQRRHACTVVTTVIHTRTYVHRCTYPISNFSRTRVSRSRCLLESRFLGSRLGVLDRESPLVDTIHSQHSH
jgi:hypothetical protein